MHVTQDVFETLLDAYYEELPDGLQTELDGFMKNLSVEKLADLLEVMHEFILLQVARRDNRDDEDYIDTANHRLGRSKIFRMLIIIIIKMIPFFY